MKLNTQKRVVVFTDCISIDPEDAPENQRYPGMLQEMCPEVEILVDGSPGATSDEAVAKVSEIIRMKPDVVVFGYGLNDALPRGLYRYQRAAIIQSMYKAKFNSRLRLMARSLFLNPLEYVMQIITKPKHYFSVVQMIENIDFCVKKMQQQGIEIIVVNINPVLNYRFINAKKYVNEYNAAISAYCASQKLQLVDVWELFKDYPYEEVLSDDKFHYSYLGHKLVSSDLKTKIENI